MENNKTPLYSQQDEKAEAVDLYQSVKTAIKKIAEKEGYIDHKIYKKTISTEGGNYLAVLYEVNIEGDSAEGRKETNLFVKHVIPNSDNMKILSISEVYTKEAFAYRELAKIFTELQNEVQVPKEDQFEMVKSYDDSTLDAIILENMSKKGFTTYSRTEIMSLKYAQLSIQQLAKFHGLSFIIEKRMPEYFETKIKSLNQSIIFDDNFQTLAVNMYELTTKNLTFIVKTKTEKFLKTLLEVYPKYLHGLMTNVKCLCHGDFKANNVLFKEIEGEVAEVIPVDYQLVYYGSPVTDLIYFLFIGTDREFRKNHLNYLKDLYYDTLRKFLEYFDILVEEVYPRKMFERDFESCLDYGLMISIILLPFLLTTEDDTPDFGKDDLMELSLSLDDRFYDRFQGVIDDFIEWGHL